MTNKERKRKTITFTLPDEIIGKLNELSKESGLNRSRTLEMIIEGMHSETKGRNLYNKLVAEEWKRIFNAWAEKHNRMAIIRSCENDQQNTIGIIVDVRKEPTEMMPFIAYRSSFYVKKYGFNEELARQYAIKDWYDTPYYKAQKAKQEEERIFEGLAI